MRNYFKGIVNISNSKHDSVLYFLDLQSRKEQFFEACKAAMRNSIPCRKTS